MDNSETIWKRIFLYLKHIPTIYRFVGINRTTKRIYRNADVWRLTSLVSLPQQKLQVFINFYKHLPKQGSALWKKAKEGDDDKLPTIGGSELGTLLNLNPYQKLPQLISSKIKLNDFRGNTSTRWGNLFEEVLFQLSDTFLRAETQETGSIPGMRDPEFGVISSYSPDRIGVVSSTELFKKVNDVNFMVGNDVSFPDRVSQLLTEKEKVIVLFEGKCPLKRIPDSKVPRQYTVQPLAGACTIPITDVCLFVDGMFRKCSVLDFDLGKEYDTEFHDKDVENCIHVDDPLVCGFIGIYEPLPPGSKPEKNPPPSSPVEDGKRKVNSFAITQLANLLLGKIVACTTTPGSDYYGLPLELKSLMSLCALADKYLESVYQLALVDENASTDASSQGFEGLQIKLEDIQSLTRRDEEEIVFRALFGILVIPSRAIGSLANLEKAREEDTRLMSLLRMLIPDALTANYKIHQDHRLTSRDGAQKLPYGEDYGAASEYAVAKMLARVIDNRFNETGPKAYYPDAFFAGPLVKDWFPATAANYQDDSLPTDGERAKKWMYKNVSAYLDWCQKNGYRSLGILPWKLFKISLIPVEKDPAFLERCRPAIIDALHKVKALKESVRQLPLDERQIILSKKFEVMFPKKRRKKVVGSPPASEEADQNLPESETQKEESIGAEQFHTDTLGDFADNIES
jgi:hypothetical protein